MVFKLDTVERSWEIYRIIVGEVAKNAKGSVFKVAELIGSVVKSRWSLFQPSKGEAMQERLVSTAATTHYLFQRGDSKNKNMVIVRKSKVEEVNTNLTRLYGHNILVHFGYLQFLICIWSMRRGKLHRKGKG
ncbi:hypothetical protein Hanom_Chr04g00342891 [Helianthus anomalus]